MMDGDILLKRCEATFPKTQVEGAEWERLEMYLHRANVELYAAQTETRVKEVESLIEAIDEWDRASGEPYITDVGEWDRIHQR